MKAYCPFCRRYQDLIDGKETKEGNKTIIVGKCKVCGHQVRFVKIDLFKPQE